MERPTTLSSLVHDFQALATRASQLLTGPVVIAIDELDKMEDPERVRDLLRDVKGVFDVPGVHVFVSVSDEAVRELRLGAIEGRGEFSSSFYTVLDLTPMNPGDIEDMLVRRSQHVDRRLARSMGILSGGIPREAVRLLDIARSAGASADPNIVDCGVSAVVQSEVAHFRKEVLDDKRPHERSAKVQADGSRRSRPRKRLSDDEKVGTFQALPDQAFAREHLPAQATRLLSDHWPAAWSGDAWAEGYEEEWRKLLVRMGIAALICARPALLEDERWCADARVAINTAAQSAAVARLLLQGLSK